MIHPIFDLWTVVKFNEVVLVRSLAAVKKNPRLGYLKLILTSATIFFLLPTSYHYFFFFRNVVPHSYSARDCHKCHFLSVFVILIDNIDTVLFSQRCYFNGHYTGEFGSNNTNSRVGRNVAVCIESFGRDTGLRFTIPHCLIWLVFIVFTTQEDAFGVHRPNFNLP